MIFDAIVPAWNEVKTVANTLLPLRESGCFRRIVLVSDGSTDGTDDVGRSLGFTVLRTPYNLGKGQALKYALRYSLGSGVDGIGFFDADLVNFHAMHAIRLVDEVESGDYVMACGLRDYGNLFNRVQMKLPPITGERVMLRSVVERVPESFWSGFRVEAGLNEAARRLGETKLVVMRGMGIVYKHEKFGIVDGIKRYWKMGVEVRRAMRDARENFV